MKLREIDKSEIFDLIASGKPIYSIASVDISRATVQYVACLKALYTEDDRPKVTPTKAPAEATEAQSDPQEEPTVPDEEPNEEEPEPVSAAAEQPQAEEEEPKNKRGRPSINKPQIINYYLLGRQPGWIAQEMRCDISTVYKTIKEHEEKQAAKRRQKNATD